MDDVGKRYSAFYLIDCVASAFGAILAYGLMQLDGVARGSGSERIFIMESVVWFSNPSPLYNSHQDTIFIKARIR